MCRDVKHNLPCGSYLQPQPQPLAKGATGDTLASYSCVSDTQLLSDPVLSQDGNVGKNILYANGTIRKRPEKDISSFFMHAKLPLFQSSTNNRAGGSVFHMFLEPLHVFCATASGGPRRPLLRYRRSALFTLFLTDSPLQLLADLTPAMYHTFHLAASLSAHPPRPQPLCCAVTCMAILLASGSHVSNYSAIIFNFPQFFLSCSCFTLPSLLTCCSPSLLLRLS